MPVLLSLPAAPSSFSVSYILIRRHPSDLFCLLPDRSPCRIRFTHILSIATLTFWIYPHRSYTSRSICASVIRIRGSNSRLKIAPVGVIRSHLIQRSASRRTPSMTVWRRCRYFLPGCKLFFFISSLLKKLFPLPKSPATFRFLFRAVRLRQRAPGNDVLGNIIETFRSL